jgi:hypothetical protein
MRIFNSALLGSVLWAGTAAVALAQSISSLPPNSGEPTQAQGQTLPTSPYGSTQSFYPKPGGSGFIPQDNSQPAAATSGPVSGADQPYPTGPKTN